MQGSVTFAILSIDVLTRAVSTEKRGHDLHITTHTFASTVKWGLAILCEDWELGWIKFVLKAQL